MITRLYADNFKTLVNFELPLGPMNLLLGANGSGKSTVLEALWLIREFVCSGKGSTVLFPASSLCRWDTRTVQTFEIDLQENEGAFTYKLEIEHDVERDACKVKSECLSYNQRPLYVSDAEGTQLYHDDGIASDRVVIDRGHAGVGLVPPRGKGILLTEFRKRLEYVWVLQIRPDKMLAKSGKETAHPVKDMSDFVAWYRYLSLDQPHRVLELTEVLKTEVLDGFYSLRLKPVGEKSRALWAVFSAKPNEKATKRVAEFRFGELSDGQRTLIALYALAICAVDEENTLCLDHPESHLALPEIQPWLLRLADATEEGRCQAIIATHHPELINLLAANAGYWLERQSGGPTRVRRIGDQDGSGLPISELIARGWLHG